MARTFPQAEVRGYDISQHALGRAESRPAAEGAINASFHDPRRSPLPDDQSADLACTFYCMHEMTDPPGIAAAIRGADGTQHGWGKWGSGQVDVGGGRISRQKNKKKC